MMDDYFHIRPTDAYAAEFVNLMNVKIQGQDLEGFLIRWEGVLASSRQEFPEGTLASLFLQQIQFQPSVRFDVEHYERMQEGHPDRSYRYLKAACDKAVDRLQGDKMCRAMMEKQKGAPPGAPLIAPVGALPSNGNGANNDGKGMGPQCFNFLQYGHYAAQCPAAVCSNCSQRGHQRANCPNPPANGAAQNKGGTGGNSTATPSGDKGSNKGKGKKGKEKGSPWESREICPYY